MSTRVQQFFCSHVFRWTLFHPAGYKCEKCGVRRG